MTADPHRHDPGSRFEDAGVPDLQDGTPEQQAAEDPQESPLPGEAPNASVDWGTTAEEQLQGEPHDLRLSREEPDPVLEEINGEPRRPSKGDGDVGMDGGFTQEERAIHLEPE